MDIIQLFYQLVFFSPAYVAVACIVVFVFLKFTSFPGGFFRFCVTFFGWGLIVGVIGFALGFFGPIIYCSHIERDCPQGPLLGIFITGPLGASLGMVTATVVWAIQARKSGPISPSGDSEDIG
jgi:hypothetical protein